MDRNEAVALLLRISKLDEESEEVTEMAKSITDTLGCLALAIIQAGAAIRQIHCSTSEYHGMYARHRRDLLDLKHSPALTDYQYTVYSTWKLSVTMIQGVDVETSRHAMDLLRIFSFMHFANISEEIFRRVYSLIRISTATHGQTGPGHINFRGSRKVILQCGVHHSIETR